MPSGNYAYLGIRGEFDPHALAAEIGLEPTKCVAKHSRDPGRKLPRTSILRFAQTHADDDGESADVYELASAVHGKLKDFTGRIADAVKAGGISATFQVVLDFPVSDEVSTPAIGFSEEVARFISEIGASIDVDTYRV